MADYSNVARPYAQAAFELAREGNDLAGWGNQLDLLARIASDSNLIELLKNPASTEQQQTGLILEVCGDSISPDAASLVKVLVKNDRINALPDISRIFAEHRAEAERIIEADMITATAIDESQQQQFVNALQTRLGRTVKLSFEVDQDLIGGAIIRAGDWVVDGSVKAQLEKLVGALAA